MSRLIDLTGQTFGRLVVLERAPGRSRVHGGKTRIDTYWLCRCACGIEREVQAQALRAGWTSSCRTACIHAVGRRPWPGAPRYLVGEDGSIAGPQGYVLYHSVDSAGYSTIGIRVGKRTRTVRIHSIVADTYLGELPPGMQVRHRDGNPRNPALSNLEWGTPAQNAADKFRHGTQPQGERVYNAKLTEQDVRNIRAAVAAGSSQSALARRYLVHPNTVTAVVHRRTWKHVA